MKIKLNCKICQKEYGSKSPNTLYCSEECRKIGNEQKKIRNYKGNIYRSNNKSYLIFERDKFNCVYCGKNSFEDNVKLCVDHLVPLKKGGINDASNVVTSCADCNRAKGDFLLNEKIANKLIKMIKAKNQKINISEVNQFLISAHKNRYKYR